MKRVQFENKKWLRIWLILVAMCVLVLILGETTHVLAEEGDPTDTPTATTPAEQHFLSFDITNPIHDIDAPYIGGSNYSYTAYTSDTVTVNCGTGNVIEGLLVSFEDLLGNSKANVTFPYYGAFSQYSSNGWYYKGSLVDGGAETWYYPQLDLVEEYLGTDDFNTPTWFSRQDEEISFQITASQWTLQATHYYIVIEAAVCYGDPAPVATPTPTSAATPTNPPVPEGISCPSGSNLYYDHSIGGWACDCPSGRNWYYADLVKAELVQSQWSSHSELTPSQIVYPGSNFSCKAISTPKPLLNFIEPVLFGTVYFDGIPDNYVYGETGYPQNYIYNRYVNNYWGTITGAGVCAFDYYGVDEGYILSCPYNVFWDVSETQTPTPTRTPTMTPTPQITIESTPTITPTIRATNTAIVPTYFPGTGTPGGGASTSGESGGYAPGEDYSIGGGDGQGSVSYGNCDDGVSDSNLPNYFEGTAFPGSSGGGLSPDYNFQIDCYEASGTPLVGATSLEMTVSPGACYLLWPHFSLSVPSLFGLGDKNFDIDGWRICPYWVTLPNLEILGLDLLNQVLMAIAAFTIIRMLWRF